MELKRSRYLVAIGAAACQEGFLTEGGCVFLAGMGGAAAGMLVGAVVGSFVMREDWRTLRVEPLTAGSGVTAGLSLRLWLPPARINRTP